MGDDLFINLIEAYQIIPGIDIASALFQYFSVKNQSDEQNNHLKTMLKTEILFLFGSNSMFVYFFLQKEIEFLKEELHERGFDVDKNTSNNGHDIEK